MAKKVIIIGGDGNGGVAASCIADMRKRYNIFEYEVEGFLNDYLSPGDTINQYPVLGGLEDIGNFLEKDYFFIWAIHSITHAPLRTRLFDQCNIPDEKLVTLIHPQTFIGEGVVLEPGVMVMANSYIGPMTKIGKCTFVMANCSIGHNDDIGPFCHFSVGATLSSVLKIGKGCDVALNATVMEKVTMGDFSVAGAGSMVLKDVESYQVVVGNPARHLKFVDKEE
jgi:sugar O-acyltransferase (sialic acid O-acetyltransferase NeuD family)